LASNPLTNYTGQLPKKIIVNVRNTRYDLVKEAAKLVFKAKLSEKDEEQNEWDLLWCDLSVPADRLMKMKDY